MSVEFVGWLLYDSTSDSSWWCVIAPAWSLNLVQVHRGTDKAILILKGQLHHLSCDFSFLAFPFRQLSIWFQNRNVEINWQSSFGCPGTQFSSNTNCGGEIYTHYIPEHLTAKANAAVKRYSSPLPPSTIHPWSKNRSRAFICLPCMDSRVYNWTYLVKR